ncbi:cell division protein ZapB [Kushneria pakistanensis]|uniref:Cell division protein ZapB n=1 Tax=Kushneria pakistanensis TaxID=1508770 RepID=A0ABQ3FL62_9GAMM|nr:cell division protein ZapB [Kushneria pakistanensis]GHC28496.1 cell division protein ZapB [Kushneria pakistanensis]
MSNELFEQLEQRVNSAVDTIEMQRMELDELRQENERLKSERQQWESRLGGLLERFRELDANATAPAPEAPAASPSW